MTRRIIVLLLVASLCFAVFTICVSAADAVSGTVVWSGDGQTLSASLGDSVPFSSSFDGATRVTSLVLVAPSAGTLTVSIYPCRSSFTASGNGSASSVNSTLSGYTSTVTIVFSNSGSAGISVTPVPVGTQAPQGTFTLVSWEPSGSSGGGDEPNPYPDSGSRWVLTDNKGNWVAGESGQQFLSTSNNWQTYSQYIGEYVTKVKYARDGTETEENSDAFMSRMLANLAYNTWDWSVSEGKLIFFPPTDAEGSFLDNMWRMNVTIYYNLVNNSGWFGMVTSNQSTIISQLGILNNRVLQILSVLANDEDVKIKDATTDHRNWIIDYFEDSSGTSGKPTTSDNDAVNNGMNTVKEQFQSEYSVGDIGSIFSGNSYDNNLWYTFWSQPVFNDVNGLSRGGFGGGKAPARAPVSSKPSWSSQYSYDDDSIPDMSGFGGGLSD